MKPTNLETVPIYQKAALTIFECAELYSIGTNNMRKIATSTDAFKFTRKVGNKTIIIRKEFDKYIEQHQVLAV